MFTLNIFVCLFVCNCVISICVFLYSCIFNWSALLSPQFNKINCIPLTRITSTSVSLPRFLFWVFFYQTGQEEELRAALRDTTVIMGGGIQFTALKNFWQCRHRPSGRHMLEAGTGLRCEEDSVVGNEKFERAFGTDFEFCSARASV